MTTPHDLRPSRFAALRLGAAMASLLFLLWACNAAPLAAPQPKPTVQATQSFPVSLKREIDILFLVDKSPTMEDEQESLARNFPRFIEVLENIQGGLPDLHLGVITQDVGAGGYSVGGTCAGEGDGGRLQNTPRIPGCRPPAGAFISDIGRADGGRDRNYTGSLAETFACIARVGPRGCGFEQHLQSLKQALDGTVPENAGFLRPDAYLAVVILSDEDDCSASDPKTFFDPTERSNSDPLGPVSDWRCAEFGWSCDGQKMTRNEASYQMCSPMENSPLMHHPQVFVDFVRGLKRDPERILVATIMGPPTPVRTGIDDKKRFVGLLPSCHNGLQNAEPMVRLKYFADKVSEQSTFVSICEPDLSGGLVRIAEVLRHLIDEPPCLTQAPLDADPRATGLQPDCVVSEIVGSRETPLPRCPGGAGQPCWKVVEEPMRCPESGLELAIDRNGAMEPSSSRLSIKCLSKK